MANYYKPGCWNVLCQVCGRKFKSDEVRTRWDGLIVCASDFEHRHILDFIRVPANDIKALPFSSPDTVDNTDLTTDPIAGILIAGSSTPSPENI